MPAARQRLTTDGAADGGAGSGRRPPPARRRRSRAAAWPARGRIDRYAAGVSRRWRGRSVRSGRTWRRAAGSRFSVPAPSRPGRVSGPQEALFAHEADGATELRQRLALELVDRGGLGVLLLLLDLDLQLVVTLQEFAHAVSSLVSSLGLNW